MDFGGFLLFGLLAFQLIVVGVCVAVLLIERSPSRRLGLGMWLAGAALLAVLGRHLYQVYWLDEKLFIAAARGNTAEVRALLSAGASPDAEWEDGTSALSAARSHGYTETVSILEKAGAKK
jgi:uncharacterized protein